MPTNSTPKRRKVLQCGSTRHIYICYSVRSEALRRMRRCNPSGPGREECACYVSVVLRPHPRTKESSALLKSQERIMKAECSELARQKEARATGGEIVQSKGETHQGRRRSKSDENSRHARPIMHVADDVSAESLLCSVSWSSCELEYLGFRNRNTDRPADGMMDGLWSSQASGP